MCHNLVTLPADFRRDKNFVVLRVVYAVAASLHQLYSLHIEGARPPFYKDSLGPWVNRSARWSTQISLELDSGVLRDQIRTT